MPSRFAGALSNLGLKWKISATIIGLILATGLFPAILTHEAMRRALLQELEEKGFTIGRNLAANMAASARLDNPIWLRHLVINAKEAEPDVSYIFVTGSNKEVLVHSFAEDLPEDLAALGAPLPGQSWRLRSISTTSVGHIRDIAVPIHEGSSGVVHVGISENHVQREIASARAKLIAIVVAALAGGVVAALYLVSIIIRPLSMFIKNVEAMARGDLSRRARLTTNDEIGRLAGAFDAMADKLEENISERKEIAAELLRAKEDWEQAFDTINDAITLHDDDFNVVRANKAAQEMLGLPLSRILTQKCYQSYHGTMCAPAGCPSCQTLKTHAPALVETYEPHLDKHLEVKALPRYGRDNQVIGLVHVVRDIDARVRAEEQRKSLSAQLLQSQKMESVGRLAGGVAHDFNNLLSAIIGYSELGMGQVPVAHPLADYLRIIREAGEKAAGLTRQLLAFSRKQVLEMKPVRLNDIINDMSKMLGRMIGEDISLELRVATRTRDVLADAGQIEQILMNLAVNARDAMPAGGSLIIETADVELDEAFVRRQDGAPPGAYVKLAVTDTGCGIAAEIVDKIFEPFFTTKERGKGTGLGLATVYGIVKQHGGLICVHSAVNHGTTFDVFLPAAGSPVVEELEKLEADLPEGTETLLIVEDEEVLRGLLGEVLGPLGYHLLAAASAEEALRVSDSYQGRIDLLLTDVVLPGMNGGRLAEKLAERRPELKVIFMSGYTDEALERIKELDPRAMFLAKPVAVKALAEKLREVLNAEESQGRCN